MDKDLFAFTNDILEKYKRDICSGITHIQHYCENRDQFDEYTYLLLWRPIEWMIDYTAFYQYIYTASHLTKGDVEQFIEESKKLSVDDKTKSDYEVILTNSWAKDDIKHIKQLRWARNAMIYHYIEESEKDPFKCFDSICKSFLEECSIGIEYKEISSPDRKIQLSEFSGKYDINNDQVYLQLKYIIDYVNDPERDRVISICKMEELVQQMAYKTLKEDLNKSIVYELDGEKGIFVDEEKVKSYIDALVDNYEKMGWLVLKKTTQDLKKIREIRNIALHVLSIPVDLENSYRAVWAETIKNTFGYDDRIIRLLDRKMAIKDSQEIIGILSSCINYYKKVSSSQTIVSLEDIIPLITTALKAASDIDDRYAEQLVTASKKERRAIEKKKLKERNKEYERIWRESNESIKLKYKDIAIEYFGAVYDSNEETYHCLETALLLYDILGDQPSEYSGICIELTKALEIYLHKKISCKLKEYLIKHPHMNIDDDVRKRLGKDNITLGDYPYMYPNHDSDIGRDFFAFCKSQGIYSIYDDALLKDELLYEMQKISEINQKYRKKSAHREIITEEKMNACMNDILKSNDPKKKAFLNSISKAMGDRP